MLWLPKSTDVQVLYTNNLGTSSCIPLRYLQMANAQYSINAKNMLIFSYMFGADNVCRPPAPVFSFHFWLMQSLQKQ